jgi:nucleoside recognition membrane protein YjiH
VRNWGALVALVGAMLIYGAFHPPVRALVLTVAGLSKLFFIGLVLTYGPHLLGHQVGIAVVVDLMMVVLFALYLLGARRPARAVDA